MLEAAESRLLPPSIEASTEKGSIHSIHITPTHTKCYSSSDDSGSSSSRAVYRAGAVAVAAAAATVAAAAAVAVAVALVVVTFVAVPTRRF